MILNQLKNKIAVPAVILLLSSTLQANTIEEFYKYYKIGHYPQALETLDKMNVDENSSSLKAYLTGLSYSKMQEYDKAAAQFAIAISLKNDSPDLYYEYGQSLFAANELRRARDAFKISAEKKFKRPESLYYVAHISQILEEPEVAKDFYAEILKEKDIDLKIRQISTFQIAEALLSIAREKSQTPLDLNRRVEKFVLPMMQKSYEMDKSTPLANDVSQRMFELKKEFNLDPDILVNGRRINQKRYAGYATQKVKFDDNISLTNEENNIQQSKKESFIFETEAYGKYDYVAKKKFIISPEARLTYTEHADRSSPEVYQNDSFVMDFALKNKYEHKIKEKPASTILDIDFSKTLKDWHAQKKKEFYSNATTFSFGESFSYFDIGDTTVKIKRKIYDGADTQISNHTTSLTADQTIFLPIQHLLIALFDASFIDNYNNPTTNTNTYLFRLDYIIPEIAPTYTLGVGLAYTITDTKEQNASRGTEKNLNPSVDISKELSSNSKISINYDFTTTSSKDTSYAYNKSVFTTEYRFSF
jgi:tetratricopeptide (TPR) repeat protein